MEDKTDISRLKTIYWTLTVIPVLLLNVTPYIGIDFSTDINNGEAAGQMMVFFAVLFVLLLTASFSSYKCIGYSKIMPTKVMASLCLLLYVVSIIGLLYYVFSSFSGHA